MSIIFLLGHPCTVQFSTDYLTVFLQNKPIPTCKERHEMYPFTWSRQWDIALKSWRAAVKITLRYAWGSEAIVSLSRERWEFRLSIISNAPVNEIQFIIKTYSYTYSTHTDTHTHTEKKKKVYLFTAKPSPKSQPFHIRGNFGCYMTAFPIIITVYHCVQATLKKT